MNACANTSQKWGITPGIVMQVCFFITVHTVVFSDAYKCIHDRVKPIVVSIMFEGASRLFTCSQSQPCPCACCCLPGQV